MNDDADIEAEEELGGERIVAVVGNLTRVSGLLGRTRQAYSLILTDRRVIFAELDRAKVGAEAKRARAEAKADSRGVLGQWNAALKTPGDYHQAYWQMTPDEALAESPGNFAVDRSAIRRVTFKTGMVDDVGTQTDRVIIDTDRERYRLQAGYRLSAVEEALHEAGIA